MSTILLIVGSDEGCPYSAATWVEAHNVCDKEQARLCFAEESNVPHGTGCGFNSEMLWTQSPCALDPENDPAATGFWVVEGKYDPNPSNAICARSEERRVGERMKI